MKKFQFTTTCVNALGKDINKMVDAEKGITRQQFLQLVDREDMRDLEVELGYAKHAKQGLTMASDYHVSYHKSKYRGKRCVFFCHSAIEYVFTAGENNGIKT